MRQREHVARIGDTSARTFSTVSPTAVVRSFTSASSSVLAMIVSFHSRGVAANSLYAGSEHSLQQRAKLRIPIEIEQHKFAAIAWEACVK